MWIKVSRIILRNKYALLGILLLITLFFGYHARQVEMSYEPAPLLPQKDKAYTDYISFTEVFGEEGNLIILGVRDPDFFDIDHFRRWQELCIRLGAVDGVENLLSLSNSYNLLRDTVNNKFIIRPLFPKEIEGQEQLDSLATKFRNLPFYRDILYNDTAQTFLLAITVNKDKMRNSQRDNLIRSVRRIGNTFEKESNLKLHYPG